jgi:hypothetical protein
VIVVGKAIAGAARGRRAAVHQRPAGRRVQQSATKQVVRVEAAIVVVVVAPAHHSRRRHAALLLLLLLLDELVHHECLVLVLQQFQLGFHDIVLALQFGLVLGQFFDLRLQVGHQLLGSLSRWKRKKSKRRKESGERPVWLVKKRGRKGKRTIGSKLLQCGTSSGTNKRRVKTERTLGGTLPVVGPSAFELLLFVFVNGRFVQIAGRQPLATVAGRFLVVFIATVVGRGGFCAASSTHRVGSEAVLMKC